MRRLSLTEISPGSAAAVVGLPPSYVSGYGGTYAPGFARRYRGDHPPELPISALEKHIMQEYQRIKTRWYGNDDIPAAMLTTLSNANEAVVAALRDDSQIGGFLGMPVFTYRYCLDNGRAEADWIDQWDYKAKCQDWEAALTHAQMVRDEALQRVSEWYAAQGETEKARQARDDAEVSRAGGEWTATPGEQGDVVFEGGLLRKPDKGWPPWLKWAIGGTAVLVTARVLLPPLYGTWLARPERATAPPLDPFEEPEI